MLAIIPARGGSKGLPGKNIRPLLGKPLIEYTIEAALESEKITDVIVSTDDEEIYNIAVKCGAAKSFLRPKEFARDDSLAIDNYIYTIKKLNSDFGFDIESFAVLQPTSPLRQAKHIDEAINLFHINGADSVISYVREAHPISWHKYVLDDGKFEDIFPENIGNRQQFRPSYYPNGAIYIFKFDVIMQGKYITNNSLAYVMEKEASVDIDTIDDFKYAEFLMINKDG